MYNAVQHPYNKEIQGVDIKKATIKSLFELLCIFNCRTPAGFFMLIPVCGCAKMSTLINDVEEDEYLYSISAERKRQV